MVRFLFYETDHGIQTLQSLRRTDVTPDLVYMSASGQVSPITQPHTPHADKQRQARSYLQLMDIAPSFDTAQNMTTSSPSLPPPIAENEFEQLWQYVVANHQLQLQERWLQFDGRQINLYQLHKVVFGMGGYQYVRFPHSISCFLPDAYMK